jgi:hypothetical protein
LPAPFGPISAWTVAGRTFKLTSVSARTPPKDMLTLVTPMTLVSGAAAIAGGISATFAAMARRRGVEYSGSLVLRRNKVPTKPSGNA